jgi:hypothetical protein
MVHFNFVLLASLLLASASSLSFATTIDLGTEDFRRWGSGTATHSLDGLRVSTGSAVRMPPPVPPISVTRASVVPYSGLTNALKNAARNSPQQIASAAAFSAIFLAVDWAFDELTGQITKNEVSCPPGDVCAVEPGPGHELSQMCGPYSYAMTELNTPRIVTNSSIYSWYGVTNGTYRVEVSHTPVSGDAGVNCVDKYPSGRWDTVNGTFPTMYVLLINPNTLPSASPTPVTDADWTMIDGQWTDLTGTEALVATGALIAAGIPKSDFGSYDDLITGPATVNGPTTTSTSTTPGGDTVVTETTPTHSFDYSPTTVTNTGSTTVTTTYTNGNITNNTSTTTNNPVAPPLSAGLDIPTDCEFMPTVCAWMEWFKTPFEAPDVDMPVIADQDFEQTFTFNLPSACPPPYMINISFVQGIEVSWQPFCDLAGYMKPLVIGSASIFAAFIVLGISRGRS